MKKGTIIAIAVAAALILLGICLSIAAVVFGARPTELFTDGSFSISINDLDDLDDIFESQYDKHGFGGNKGQSEMSSRPSEGVSVNVSEDENNYTVTADISKIVVDWVSGNVKIVRGEGRSITFSERASGGIKADDRLVYSVEGNTLKISCCDNESITIGFNIDNGCKNKELIINVPYELFELSVDTTSADVEISDLEIERQLYVSTTSGAVTAGEMKVGSVNLDSTSGRLDFSGNCSELYADTVSGNISFGGTCSEFEADSTSGKVTAAFFSLPREISADTVSGAVELSLPADAGFELEFDTVSGDLDSDFAMKMHDGDYYAGAGGIEINVDTVSGGLKIKSK